jgi:hypothetical protein
MPKQAQFTHQRVEYKVFLFDEPLNAITIRKKNRQNKKNYRLPFEK